MKINRLTILLISCFFFSNTVHAKVNLLDDIKFKSFYEEFSEFLNSISQLSMDEQRLADTEFKKRHSTFHETVHHLANVGITGRDNHTIPIRIYVPTKEIDLPVIVFFHGGGWAYGSIEDYDDVCRRLAIYTGSIVASIGYRLAPEHPFPKPLEDCLAATNWIAENARFFGGNSSKIMVAGDSAGGNLAGAVAKLSRDTYGPPITAQILLYPAITSQITETVYDECPDQYFLTKESMRFFWDMYAPTDADKSNAYASLEIGKHFKNLPPALIITAEYDPLKNEAENYGNLLREANIPVAYKSMPGLVHGFLSTPLYSNQQKIEWTKEIKLSLEELLYK